MGQPNEAYVLVSVDGQPLPADVVHDSETIRVYSGDFRFFDGNICRSRTVFGPAQGDDRIDRENEAEYTRTVAGLRMQWKGAGQTVGSIDGEVFTMNNEGMLFRYKRKAK